MPGRYDQLEQINSRVRSNAKSQPRPQGDFGKSDTSLPIKPHGGNAPKSFFGGNYDVYSKLESVEFQGIFGDDSMRGDIAHIRLWKRGGTNFQQPSASLANTRAISADSQLFSGSGLEGIDTQSLYNSNLSLRLGEKLNLPWLNNPNFATASDFFSGNYSVPSAVFQFTDPSGQPILSNFLSQEERQKNIGKVVPRSETPARFPFGGFFGTNVPREQRPLPFLQSPRLFGSRPIIIPNNPLGGVRSANPNGVTNALNRALLGAVGFRESFPSYLKGPRSSPPPYSGSAKASKTEVSMAPEGEKMWQFLFNPSELELDVGPEFKAAETWGVSDKSNSGQPLHWSHNKNAKLKFNSVLLNGFIFGKKVEALEQGLMELFMARDGEGQHGPYVLEFVWGKRTFGPCVLRDINIKERMWDEGEVVNAELSFILEQVPEWTINDGAYVDVARPGRRPLQEDPAQFTTQQGGAQGGTQGGTDQPPPPGSEGGDRADQKGGGDRRQGPALSSTYKQCQEAFKYQGIFSSIRGRLTNFQFEKEIITNPFDLDNAAPRNRVNNAFLSYKSTYNKASSILGTDFTSRMGAAYAPDGIFKRAKESGLSSSSSSQNIRNLFALLRVAVEKAIAACKNIFESAKCKKAISDTNKLNQRATQNRLNDIGVGDRCTIGAGNVFTNPKTKQQLVCGSNGRYRLP